MKLIIFINHLWCILQPAQQYFATPSLSTNLKYLLDGSVPEAVQELLVGRGRRGCGGEGAGELRGRLVGVVGGITHQGPRAQCRPWHQDDPLEQARAWDLEKRTKGWFFPQILKWRDITFHQYGWWMFSTIYSKCDIGHQMQHSRG